MFLLAKPSDEQIRNVIAAQRHAPFSYLNVGATNNTPPAHFRIDHNRIKLGAGQATFDRAVAAMQRWEMFNFPWMQLCWSDVPIEAGTTVALAAAAFGLWTLSVCRIVYTIDEERPLRRYGFAYGTLPEHVARGEERFQIEWDRANDSVWYDIIAFSQPNQLLTRLGYPAMRISQKRFARDSKQAMLRVVTG